MMRSWSSPCEGRRRGAAAMEFLFTFPIMCLLFAGTVDYGHYFSMQSMVETIARDACRRGAMADPGASASTASDIATVLLTEKNIDCVELNCVNNMTYVDETGGDLDHLDCQVVMDFDPMAGLLYFGTESGLPAVPAQMQGRAVMPMDIQVLP